MVVIGTRPEAIKLAPVVHAIENSDWARCTLVLTGQHRDLVQPIVDYFGLKVAHDLRAMQPNQSLAQVTARILADRFSGVTVFQVEDTGPGIPLAERELVFQPFYRALGTDTDGSGLGLPIVLEIAHQHNATVTVEDAHPGRQPPGARFTVRFARTMPSLTRGEVA